MPTNLSTLAAPGQTALLVLEMQNGIVGPAAGESPIAQAVEEQGIIPRCAELAKAARAVGIRVVHCTKTERIDGLAATLNTPMWRRRARIGFEPMLVGSVSAAVPDGLTIEPEDIVCTRTRGVTAFGGTELDAILRNLGVRTVVLAGVSVNVGIIAAAADAISCGYEVVVATDAVAGAPSEYVEQVLKFSLAPLATLVPAGDMVAVWG
jgi:nicotinamidase-related amidase